MPCDNDPVIYASLGRRLVSREEINKMSDRQIYGPLWRFYRIGRRIQEKIRGGLEKRFGGKN